jgi:hypothetical protein
MVKCYKEAGHRKSMKAVAVTMTAVPLVFASSIASIPGLANTAHASLSAPIEDRTMLEGESFIISSPSVYAFSTSSNSSFDFNVTYESSTLYISAASAGTYTVYLFDNHHRMYDSLDVTVESHRMRADVNNDGLIDISEVVNYIPGSPDVYNGEDGEFNEYDIEEMLGWINGAYDVNQAPVFVGTLGDQIVNGSETISLQVDSVDIFNELDEENLTYTAFTDDASVAILEVDRDGFTDLVTIHGISTGTTHGTIRAHDQSGLYVDKRFQITVTTPETIPNQAPVLINSGTSFLDNEPNSMNLYSFFSDNDNDELTFTLNPDHTFPGTITMDGGNWEFPSLNITTDTYFDLEVTATDGFGGTTTGTITITMLDEMVGI